MNILTIPGVTKARRVGKTSAVFTREKKARQARKKAIPNMRGNGKLPRGARRTTKAAADKRRLG